MSARRHARGARQDSVSVQLLPEGFVKHSGGVRRSSYELLAALRAQGVSIDVAPWVDQNEFQFGAPNPSTSRRMLLQAQTVGRQLRHPRPAVTHSLYYDPTIVLSSGPKVATVYDMIHERVGSGSAALQRAKRIIVTRTDVVVAISQATADDLRNYYPDAARTVVIPLGVSASMISDDAAPDRSARQYVLYVGYRGPHKNFPLLLDAYRALSQLRELPLVLVGGPTLTAAEHAEIEAATGRQVRHHRGADDVALRDLYDEALVTVVPSRWEGFGLPVLEAMARWCPVACSNTPSLAQTAGGHAELFDPDSAEECASSILAAADRTEDRVAAARGYAARHTWAATAKAHADLYAEVS